MKTDTDTETGTDTITIPSADERGPREYIRTLSGDMMTLQKGGVPDLKLVKGEEGANPLGAYLTEVAPKQTDEKNKIEKKEEIKKEEPIIEKMGVEKTHIESAIPSPSERLIEASPVLPVSLAIPKETAVPPVSIEIPPAEPPPEVSKPSPLETYSNDFVDRMKSTKASPVTVLAAQADAGMTIGQVDPEALEEAPQKGRWIIAGGALLLLAGMGGMFYAYAQYASTHHLVEIAPSVMAPIFVDSRQDVAGTGAELLKAIKQATQDPMPSNTVRLLTLTTPAVTTDNILSILKTHAPGLLIRNIAPGGTIGVVNTSNGQSPFFIMTVESYGATFSGMLAWEPTIFNDLGALFPFTTTQSQTGGPATASTTSATTTPLAAPKVVNQKPGFKDEVMSNHDVRVYRDAFNKSAIVYGYWNQSTLIIARDSLAFAEVITRLSNASAPQ